jgi:O-antigen/teichoic acid export membrane protein
VSSIDGSPNLSAAAVAAATSAPEHGLAAARRLPHKVAVMGISTFSVAVMTFITIRIYALHFAPAEISTLLIYRLYSSVVLALSSLGMPIAVQRSIAFLHAQPRRAATSAVAGIVMGSVGVGGATLLLIEFAGRAVVLFGRPDTVGIWRATMCLMFVQSVATLFSYIEVAHDRIRWSAFVLFWSFGVAPLLAVWLPQATTLPAMIYWAALLAPIGYVPSIYRLVCWVVREGTENWFGESWLLVKYGLRRVIANTLEWTIDPSLPWLALRSGVDVLGAGYLAIGLSLMRPLSPITSALNQVMVPASAVLTSANQHEQHQTQVRRILQGSVHLGIFGSLQLAVWADVLIRIWLGNNYIAAIPTARVICLALAPMFIYVSARGIIDGQTEKAINARNLAISFAVMLAVGWMFVRLHLGVGGLIAAYLVGRMMLAWLTMDYSLRSCDLRLRQLRIGDAAFASIVAAALTMGARFMLPAPVQVWMAPVLIIAAAVLFTWRMSVRNVEWSRLLVKRLGWSARLGVSDA